MASRCDDFEHQIPSYDEATKGSTTATSHADRVRQLQSARVLALLQDHILPFVESQTSEGLTHFSIILVPTDVGALRHHLSPKLPLVVEKLVDGEQPADQREEILGFPDHETVKLLRLTGNADTSKFWQQPQVIQRLEASLRERLGIANDAPSTSRVEKPPTVAEKAEKRGFWRKKSSGPSTSSSPWDANGVSSLGLAAMKRATQASLAPGQVAASISIEEISLRTLSEFELFEVRNGRAVVARIRIGA